ncbi:hypothetical protein KI387_033902, partial [Taxus chinensis]
GTAPSELALLGALHGDLSAHVGQTATAWKTQENLIKIVHESNKVDSESFEWEIGSETDVNTADLETETMEGNRQIKSMKDHKQRPLNVDLNSGRRTMESSSEKITLLTLEARNSNFDSPKLIGNLEVVLDVDDENKAEWST